MYPFEQTEKSLQITLDKIYYIMILNKIAVNLSGETIESLNCDAAIKIASGCKTEQEVFETFFVNNKNNFSDLFIDVEAKSLEECALIFEKTIAKFVISTTKNIKTKFTINDARKYDELYEEVQKYFVVFDKLNVQLQAIESLLDDDKKLDEMCAKNDQQSSVELKKQLKAMQNIKAIECKKYRTAYMNKLASYNILMSKNIMLQSKKENERLVSVL